MTNGSTDRLDRIEALLERFIEASVTDRQTSNERMTRIEQAVESNNRFLEAFSADLKHYANRLDNFTARIDGVIATSNQDRDEIKTQLNAIRRQVTKGDQPQP